jgi:hypothetical protein
LARAEPWLLRAELENAMALASARHARADDSHYQQPIYWATVEDGSEIVGCAFRTPPYRVGVSALPSAAIESLVASLSEYYTSLSGVSGPEATAGALADAWTERYGGTWSVHSRQRLLSLASLAGAPRPPPPGALRRSTATCASN